MRTSIKNAGAAMVLASACCVFSGHSQAAALPLGGSVSFSAAGGVVLSGGSDLFVQHLTGFSEAQSLFASPLVLSLVNTVFGSTNTGDFVNLNGQSFTANPGNALVLADSSSYVVQAGSTIGVFIPDPNSVSFLSTANFLNIFSTGVLTPGLLAGTQAGGCATGGNTCAPTVSALNLSFTKTGSAVSMSGTLFSPAPGVPEPASLSLLGIGLAGWLANRHRPKHG